MSKQEAATLKAALTESVWQMKEGVYDLKVDDLTMRDEVIEKMDRNRDDLLELIDSLVKGTDDIDVEIIDTNKKEVKVFGFMFK